MTTTTVTERITAGVAWLDANVPGWVDRVEVNAFDIMSPCNCVLGQVFVEQAKADMYATDGFWYAVDHVFTPQAARSFGFDAVQDDFDEWEELQAGWETVIAALKSERVSA